MKATYHKIIPRFGCAVLFTATAIWPARADYNSTVQSHNPIAYWQFNETGPSPAAKKLANSGSLGSPGDAYGNGNLVTGVAGKVNNAAQFMNSGGAGFYYSHCEVPYNAGLASSVFSVELWAMPSATYFSGGLFSDGTGACVISDVNPNRSGGSRVGWIIYLDGTSQKWYPRLGLSSGYATPTTFKLVATASANVWQHLVFTYDGSVAKFYVNGVLDSSFTTSAASTGWVPNPESFLRFGGTPLPGSLYTSTADDAYYLPWDQAAPVQGNRGFDGMLDEVAIYTNVLSAPTILAHYNAATTPGSYGATVLADHPTGYWNFDEAAVSEPARSALPILANAGSALSAADATNEWGALVAQPGPGYSGFAAGDKAVAFNLAQSSLTVKAAPALQITGNITMAAWVKPLAANYVHDIIEHGFDAWGAETFLRTTRGSGYGNGAYYEVGATEGAQGLDGWYDSVLSPIPPGDFGNWVFLAGTFDGANWSLYRNGMLVGSVPPWVGNETDTGAFAVTNTWTIGSRALANSGGGNADNQGAGFFDGNNFAGSIAEPAIFNTALSALDILALYNAAKVPPVFTRALQNPGTVFKGSTVSFDFWLEGSPTLGYHWTSNGVPLSVTATNFTISNIQNGSYTIAVTATNGYGTNTTSVTFASVSAPPSITTTINPEWRFVGAPFNFTVGAGGTVPLTYFWYFGSGLVQAGASPTYSGIASLANSGNYTVIVSNETSLFATSGPVVLNAITVPGGYPGAVNSSAPIAYWRLGESSGTVAHDVIGGNDGTYYNTALGVSGYSVLDPDTAASFSGPNSYVGNINGAGTINFPGHPVFTLEAWVKAPAGSQTDEATIIAKGIGSSGTSRTEQFSLDVAAGVYRFFTYDSGTAVYEVDAGVGPNGSWQHIACVYDDQNVTGGGTNMYIYVNGNLENQRKTRAAGVINTTSAVSIGSKRLGNDPTYDGTFNGTIDEVAIYNTALSQATIQAHFAAAYGSSTAPFIAVQPTPTTNYAGLPVTLTVVAAGTQPLSYQWKRNNVDLTSASATTSELVIDPVSAADAGTYKVGITNSVSGIESISVPLAVLSAPTNPPAIPGLVVHLKFDGDLTDATGRGNNGVSINSQTNPIAGGGYVSNVVAATFAPDGKLGQAFHFATDAINTGGTTSKGTNDFYATLGVRPDLQFGSNVSFSVAYWIRLPQGYQGGDLPFFTDAAGSEGNNGFVFAPAYAYGTANPNPGVNNDPTAWLGCWSFSVYGGGNGIRVYGNNAGAYPGSINDGNWHHLVHVFDRAAGTDVTYLDGRLNNGVKQSGTTLTSAGNIDTGLPATIGQDPTGLYGESGSADIDDLGVWRKALTPLEAASIYVAAASSNLSYAYVDVSKLSIQLLSNSKVELSWAFGTLQAAGNVQGPYTNVTSAVSPYTNSVTAGHTFYRVAY